MKQVIYQANKLICDLVVEEGVIETLRRLKCNERLSFISPEYIIEKGTVVYYFVNLFGKGKIGENCIISSYCEIQNGVQIGSNCKIGCGSFIPEGTQIGNCVFLGPKTVICNDKFALATNPDGTLKKKNDWQLSPVKILDGASIGAASCLLPGITIGKNAVIGAGSVVTHSVGDNEVWFGNPARPQIKDEVWKDFSGYEGLYKISNYGRVGTFQTKGEDPMLKAPQKDIWGYNGVILYKNQTSKHHKISRLVASAFIPNPENKPVVNHKNGLKWDDRASNLEWVTQKENIIHAIETGLTTFKKGKDHPQYGKTGKQANASKPVLQLDASSGNIIAEFESITAAAKVFNCSKTSIGNAIRGRNSLSMGFKWRFKDESPNEDQTQKNESPPNT